MGEKRGFSPLMTAAFITHFMRTLSHLPLCFAISFGKSSTVRKDSRYSIVLRHRGDRASIAGSIQVAKIEICYFNSRVLISKALKKRWICRRRIRHLVYHIKPCMSSLCLRKPT